MYIFLLVLGGGQDKPAWTACPPGVKITRVGARYLGTAYPPGGSQPRLACPPGDKLSRGQDKLGHPQIKKVLALSLSGVVFIMPTIWHFNIYEQDKFRAQLRNYFDINQFENIVFRILKIQYFT